MSFNNKTIQTQECIINRLGQIRIKQSFLLSFITRFYRFINKNR